MDPDDIEAFALLRDVWYFENDEIKSRCEDVEWLSWMVICMCGSLIVPFERQWQKRNAAGNPSSAHHVMLKGDSRSAKQQKLFQEDRSRAATNNLDHSHKRRASLPKWNHEESWLDIRNLFTRDLFIRPFSATTSEASSLSPFNNAKRSFAARDSTRIREP